MPHVDVRKLKAELVRQGSTLTKLARKMKIPVSTLSAWLHRVHRPPADLAGRIEKTLSLGSGSISTDR
jgi:transcriptional regulator with XRE-family HTH domain